MSEIDRPSPVCRRCKGRGYLVEDAAWEPLAIQCPDCRQPSPDKGETDARRYRRLRILGCAPIDTPNLKDGTVMRFTTLDAHLDADIKRHPSRGEFEYSSTSASPDKGLTECRQAAAVARVSELETVCAELYQVIGSLSDYAGLFDHPDVIKALDNASDNALTHKDLLPWPKEPLPPAAVARARAEAFEEAAKIAELRSAKMPHDSDLTRGYAEGRIDAASDIRAQGGGNG